MARARPPRCEPSWCAREESPRSRRPAARCPTAPRLTPIEALRTATLAAAEYRGTAAHEGTIAPGKRADLVLLDADPLLDIANVSRVRVVIADGRLLDRTALDDLLSRARSATNK